MKRRFTIIVLLLIIVIAYLHFKTYGSINISVVGDILLDRGVKDTILKHAPVFPYEKVSEILNKSDITVGNLECPITNNGTPILKKSNLIFRGNPNNIASLYQAGFRVFNLANNHTMDYGPEGLKDTIKLLKSSGISVFGAGLGQVDASKPLYIHKNGFRIGFLGFSAFPPEGYFFFEISPDVAHLNESKLQKTIQNAKKNCDILIVMFHWGKEFDFYPNEHQQSVAHLACDSGADIVIGHHPHVLQGVEKYKNKYIFYSLGNFVFDRQIPNGTDETGILELTVSKKGITKITFEPVRIINCQPTPCFGSDAISIVDRLTLFSKDMGASIKFNSNRAIIN